MFRLWQDNSWLALIERFLLQVYNNAAASGLNSSDFYPLAAAVSLGGIITSSAAKV